MSVPVKEIQLSKNTVNTGETFIISVSVIEHRFLNKFAHLVMRAFTHNQLKEGEQDGYRTN